MPNTLTLKRYALHIVLVTIFIIIAGRLAGEPVAIAATAASGWEAQ